MGKANISRQALIEAIATLEARREPVGEDNSRAIDTALLALREKLATLQAEPGGPQRHQLVVLVADLSGFTALSEHMDAERVHDAINAMWEVLDGVILAWGGQIDQHAGDSLMALFGLPRSHQGDAARALYAALSMQRELALFNERARQAAADPFDDSWVGEWPGPAMRIGVHSGLVYFARTLDLAANRRPTAVGETVAIARRLEKLAPAGLVLTSTTTRRQTHGRFIFEPFTELPITLAEEEGFYVMAGARAMTTAYLPGEVAGQVTRLVGRVDLIDRLQMALQTVADSRTPHLVTLVGYPGAGKSRLVHEFEVQARLLSGSPSVLRAGTQGAFPDLPYALIRDFLLRRFSIRPQDSPYLVEDKLQQGLTELSGDWPNSRRFGPLADALPLLEGLLGVRSAADVSLEEVSAVIESLLTAITAGGPAIVVMEGINRADRRSLDLIDHLVQQADIGPVLFLGLATATEETNPEDALPWLGRGAGMFSPVERLEVPLLSAVNSRLMATEVLNSLSPIPMRLLDLIVAESGGNPLYIETLIQLLIEQGIIAVGEHWRVDMDRAEHVHLPRGLPHLIEARLATLPLPEQKVLQYASIFGPLCWDTALLELLPEKEVGEIGVEKALLSLELKGYLVADDVNNFGASQAYVFRRDSVRQAAYMALSADRRRYLHLEAANWLITHQGTARLGTWFPVGRLIAHHFAAAGEEVGAEVWRQRTEVKRLAP